jgi:hypothetical protein
MKEARGQEQTEFLLTWLHHFPPFEKKKKIINKKPKN